VRWGSSENSGPFIALVSAAKIGMTINPVDNGNTLRKQRNADVAGSASFRLTQKIK
jgi:hypothetical protein